MKNSGLLLSLVLIATSLSSRAGVIETLPGPGGYQLDHHEPIGQSFIAEDRTISFAFYYSVINPSFANDPMQLSLVSGHGVHGEVLATKDFALNANFKGFFDIDFSSAALVTGQSYTAVITNPGTSPYWAIETSNTSYHTGYAYLTGNKVQNFNWAFRVTPIQKLNDVPEPATLLLIVFGLAGLSFSRSRLLNTHDLRSASWPRTAPSLF